MAAHRWSLITHADTQAHVMYQRRMWGQLLHFKTCQMPRFLLEIWTVRESSSSSKFDFKLQQILAISDSFNLHGHAFMPLKSTTLSWWRVCPTSKAICAKFRWGVPWQTLCQSTTDLHRRRRRCSSLTLIAKISWQGMLNSPQANCEATQSEGCVPEPH